MKTDFHLNDVLLLGDSRLYQPCAAIMEHELPELPDIVNAMANVILEFRARYGAGRAIAAPQLGVMKRLVVLNIDRPVAMINPELSGLSQEMMELWDDCMSFPNLLVRLRRHRRCKLRFATSNGRNKPGSSKTTCPNSSSTNATTSTASSPSPGRSTTNPSSGGLETPPATETNTASFGLSCSRITGYFV